MTHYSFEPRVMQKAMDFCLLLEMWIKMLVKI